MKHTATSRNALLDALRAASALIVMVGHLRNAILPDYQELHDPTIFDKVFYLISGMGHQAVLVFFVLSGYLVGGAVWHQREHFSFKSYGVARLSRLWTTLVPALMLTWLADQVLLSQHPLFFQSAEAQSWHSAPDPQGYSNSVSTALANLFFLQSIEAPSFGTNGPLWSLANEALYYAMFPLLMLLAWPHPASPPKPMWRGAYATMLALWCWWVPVSMAILFLPWLLGALIHRIKPTGWLKSRVFGALSVGALVAMLLATRLGKVPDLIPSMADLCLGACVFLVLLFIHQRELDLRLPTARKISIFLSDISFSLYVIHMPLVFVAGGVLLEGQKITQPLLAYGAVLSGGLTLVLCAWLFWRAFESQTPWVKAWMLRTISTGAGRQPAD